VPLNGRKDPFKSRKQAAYLFFLIFSKRVPNEIHSSYHLGVNRAYGTATERVYFPGSLPHTTGIEEVVLSSFKETRLTRSTNIKSGGNFYVFA
jgi:hypothetical protein